MNAAFVRTMLNSPCHRIGGPYGCSPRHMDIARRIIQMVLIASYG
jgi:hypothetical protein